GQTDYALQVKGSYNIHITSCKFRDLPRIHYGASGADHWRDPCTDELKISHDVTWQSCTFTRIGTDDHSHMIYNNDSRNLNIFGCKFKDCSGHYVRFRKNTNSCAVSACTFESTGSWPLYPCGPRNTEFIVMTEFNKYNTGPYANEYFAHAD